MAAIYQLPFPISTTAGNWYIGVLCKECNAPILRLDDAPNVRFEGDGQLFFPCDSCNHEGLYASSDLQRLQAAKTQTSVKDQRISPSGSGRRPFKGKYSKSRPTMGMGALEHRPAAAQLVGRCIAYWTAVEASQARLLAKVLRADSDAAIALYLSLRNARSKTDAMDAVIEVQLNSRDRELFGALMAYKDEIEKQRNDIAHGVLGVARSVKEGIVWMSTTDFATYQVHAEAYGVSGALWQEKFESKCYVYELGDLETLARSIEDLDLQINFFIGYLGTANPTWRDQRYKELCGMPRVKETLTRLRSKRKK